MLAPRSRLRHPRQTRNVSRATRRSAVRCTAALCAAAAVLSYGAASVSADAALSPATITLSELLRRSHAAEGRLASGAYRVVLQHVAGADTTTIDSYSDADGYKTTETMADIVTSWGELDGRSWYRNANGFVQNVSGAYHAHDPIENAVSDMTAPSSGATLEGLNADASPAYVVKVTPHEGLSETRYYDTATYLLQRVDVTEYDGRTRTVVYTNYRRVAGRMVPWTRTYSSDFSKGARRYDVVTYTAVPKDPANLAIPPSTGLFDLQGRTSITIPADFTPDGIIVRMNVGQRGLDLLLDSGSSQLLINSAAASDLGVALHDKRTESFGGLFTSAQARVTDVSVGALHAPSAVVDVVPLDEPIAPTQRIVGLLGCDFFASGALEIDFGTSTLTMFAHVPSGLLADGWTEIPTNLDACVPLVKATFSGVPGQFILDTGAYSTVLYDHYFAQFKKSAAPANGEPLIESGSFIGGDEVRLQGYSMRTFGIGGLLFADATVVVPLTTKVQASDYDGLIGRETLGSFKVLFDYPNQRAYLKAI